MHDTEISQLIEKEALRQKAVVNLIASENEVSRDVLAALASPFGNKYAEGYPGARYYEGVAICDELEHLAQKRARELFQLSPDTWHVNVQALSGTPANLAVYVGLLPIGATILAMGLSAGGHLSHGSSVSFTGKAWKQVSYGVSQETGYVDYDEVARLANEHRPAMIIAGHSAYSRILDFVRFRTIADSVGALFLVDMSHIAGLVAGGVHPSPFPYADVVTTTTHKTLRGPRGALIFTRIEEDDGKRASLIEKAVFPGIQGGPHMNAIAGIAVALGEANTPDFRVYIEQVAKNARVLSDEIISLGGHIVSGGTDNHLMLLDTEKSFGISGGEFAGRLAKAGIIANKNGIPFDTRSPKDPSGVRFGTPCMTTRGWKEDDFRLLGKQIVSIARG